MNTRAAIDVIDERVRQLEAEDWDYEHDDEHIHGELIDAAVCYAYAKGYNEVPASWPWGRDDWNPKDERRNLVIAAALLIAEIERIDRAE